MDFSPMVEGALSRYIDGVGSGGKCGLWVCGPRRSGTTTIGREAVSRLMEALPPEYLAAHGDGFRKYGKDLERTQRAVWSQENLMRGNPNDYALWQETTTMSEAWENLWECSVLMIDDLISPDVDFWKKFLLIRLDQRVKDGLYTVIAGTALPRAFGKEWGQGFSDLFEVIDLLDR